MKAKIKQGAKFIIVATKRKVEIEKVDLKGVHFRGEQRPVQLFAIINQLKDRVLPL